MKKVILAAAAVAVLAIPAAHAKGLRTPADKSLDEALFIFAQQKSGSQSVRRVDSDAVASSFQGFAGRKPLPSTLEPIVQAR